MRFAGFLLLALATFCVFALGFHLTLPLPEVAGVTRKLRFLREHNTEIDTIFVGSSRVYHGVNPAVFDKEMAAAGEPTHSYNLGIDGMLPPETFFVVDRILAEKPRGLRWVFIELEDVQVSVAPDHIKTRRALYWHDWERSWTIIRKLLELDEPEKWKQKRVRLFRNRSALLTDVLLYARNLANIGRAFDLLGLVPKDDDLPPSDYEPRGDGYAPTSVQMDPKQIVRFRGWLESEQSNPRPREVDRYADVAFRKCADAFRAIAVTPIFFVMPGSRTFLPTSLRDPSPEIVFAFNDPNRYPSLYLSSARIDEGHLNAAGAEDLSKLLATRLLEVERGQKK